jgi:hypothetical protein
MEKSPILTNKTTKKNPPAASCFDRICDFSFNSGYKMQQMLPHEQMENILPDVPITFVRCEAQQNVHVFIPEAFDPHLVTTVAENFR